MQLRVFNNTARYVDQGGGRRKGSFAIWLEPWHLDVVDFLQLRKNTGAEEDRARGECFYLVHSHAHPSTVTMVFRNELVSMAELCASKLRALA